MFNLSTYQIQFGGVCWKKLELILNKIPTLT